MRVDLIAKLKFNEAEYLQLLQIYFVDFKKLNDDIEMNQYSMFLVHKLKANGSLLGFPELFNLLNDIQKFGSVNESQKNELLSYERKIEAILSGKVKIV